MIHDLARHVRAQCAYDAWGVRWNIMMQTNMAERINVKPNNLDRLTNQWVRYGQYLEISKRIAMLFYHL